MRKARYWYHAHPRTKGTTGYPDLIYDKACTKNDRYLGVAFKPGMGMDLSETRMCEWRCFDVDRHDEQPLCRHGLRPKYIIADIDTYQKGPEDDLYPNFPVNYLRLDRVPGPDEDWSPVLTALRNGNFFVTTGRSSSGTYSVEGTGAKRTIVADVEWTFPLSFVEVVWGDGKNVDRQIISATDLVPSARSSSDSVRRDGQGMGAVCGVGLGGKRGIRPAHLGQAGSQRTGEVRRYPLRVLALRLEPRRQRVLSIGPSLAWDGVGSE